jgi:hypothetical protein
MSWWELSDAHVLTNMRNPPAQSNVWAPVSERVQVKCKECDMALCIRECFAAWKGVEQVCNRKLNFLSLVFPRRSALVLNPSGCRLCRAGEVKAVWDSRFSQWWKCGVWSCGLWYGVVLQVPFRLYIYIYIEEHITSVFIRLHPEDGCLLKWW